MSNEGTPREEVLKRELTPSQLTVMKCIWDAGQRLSYQDLEENLVSQFGREYRRSTVITFLRQLTDKGYVRTQRVGRFAYVEPLVTEQEFQKMRAREETNRWYQGHVSNFLSAFVASGGIDDEEISRIRNLLDELER